MACPANVADVTVTGVCIQLCRAFAGRVEVQREAFRDERFRRERVWHLHILEDRQEEI